VHQPKNDPFFEELRAEIQESIEEAARGELVEEEEVWRRLDAAIARARELEKAQAKSQ
jgi:predicted transcriptional regulator